jgi:aspartyl-tRNA(Asn)/glutamyl-tRNA(Gln) amidotransferase subunit A
MQMVRRRFLHLAGAATALLASPYVVRAQQQAARTGASPPRSARDRLEEALARIADPNGEGSRACLTIYAQAARAAADAADARARAGISLGPLDGAIVSVKDLFDVAGEPTRAGSKVLADAPPAATDAPVLRRLRAAGAVIAAKTNMTEFAFSGIGANPHYGTPGNPADRTRVPGGSSSGAVVAVADGMCEIAIGSDTGGSTRVPAALCGVVDTSRPSRGCRPKARSPFRTRSIRSGRSREASRRAPPPMRSWPATIPGRSSRSRCRACGSAFPRGFRSAASIRRSPRNFPTRPRNSAAPACACPTSHFRSSMMVRVNSKATFAVAESWSIHRERLATRAADYDPFVRSRIEAGRTLSAADYMAMLRDRTALVRAMDARLSDLDALVLPTTPIVAPTIAETSSSEGFTAKNALVLRNPAIANFFDLCAISLPLPRAALASEASGQRGQSIVRAPDTRPEPGSSARAGGLPVGVMLFARNGHDRRLFRIAAAVERLFAG